MMNDECGTTAVLLLAANLARARARGLPGCSATLGWTHRTPEAATFIIPHSSFIIHNHEHARESRARLSAARDEAHRRERRADPDARRLAAVRRRLQARDHR